MSHAGMIRVTELADIFVNAVVVVVVVVFVVVVVLHMVVVLVWFYLSFIQAKNCDDVILINAEINI